MEKSLNNNQKAIDYLLFLRDKEIEKPQNEMDFDLIEACVELLLDLQNKKADLSPEQIEERVRKIPFADAPLFKADNAKEKVRKPKKKKILLIAAIIAILVALFSIASIAFEWNIFDEIRNRFGALDNAPVGQEQYSNGVTFIYYGKDKFYGSLEEMVEQENLDILIPNNLPNELKVKTVSVYEVDGSEKIFFSFNDENLSFFILLKNDIPNAVTNGVETENLSINGYKCYIENLNDIGLTIAHFVYNGNYYSYTYNDKQILLDIIKNLEE